MPIHGNGGGERERARVIMLRTECRADIKAKTTLRVVTEKRAV